MQQAVSKRIEVNLPVEQAFNAFINELSLWWPHEYTWSKDKLVEISMEPIPGGLCTEKGPNNFRCDWGTVAEVKHGAYISIKWQISPTRVPEPDPDKASVVVIRFKAIDAAKTRVELRHDQFENHGEGHETYCNAMDSQQGWEYILDCFAKHARRGSGITPEVKS